MSSSRPPPPPPKPPRLQAKRPYRPAAVLPIEAVTLPREAMESTEYLDVKHMIISKHVGIDQVDRATDHVDMVRTEPAQVAEQFFESPKPTDAQPIENQYYESVSSPELEIVDMQIEDDDHNEEEEDEKITDIVLNQDKSIETDDVVDEDNQQYEYFDEKQIPSNKSVNLLSDHVQRHSVQECNEEEEEYDEEALNKDIELAKSTKPLLFEIEEEKLLDHLRMRNPELLPKLIKMHLLMLLDLNGDTFASIFEESATVIEEGKRLGTIKRRKHESKNQDKSIFQQVLTEEGICRMYLLIDFIGKESNIDQEGIFRKCGSSGRQQELKYKLQQQNHVPLDGGEYTVHDCSNVLKACLSELPDPLLSERFYKLICQFDQLKLDSGAKLESSTGSRQLKIIQLILLLLPEQRKKFACDLLNLLQRVGSTDNSRNRMDAHSLATLFAPHLLCPRALAAAELQKAVPAMTDLLEFLITHEQQVFRAPAELLLDVRRALSTKVIDNDTDYVRSAYTFCQPETETASSILNTKGGATTSAGGTVGSDGVTVDDDRNDVKSQYTQRHVAELYAYVQQLPDSPHKRRLVKQFNRQNGGLTPQPDKENAAKRKGPGARVAIRLMGDKLRAMRDKVTAGKGLLGGSSSSRRPGSSHDLESKTIRVTKDDQQIAARSGRSITRKMTTDGRVRSRSSDDLLEVWDSCEEVYEIHEAAIDVPLCEMTTTRFCIDDEDALNESPSKKPIHKKRIRAASADDILADVPYTSESIIV